jgi:Secretion system C-terminal sorting domain
MKKFFLLTSLAFSCCFLCVAQQELHTNDSAVDKQQAAVGGDGSAFTNFSVEVKESNKVSLQWNVEHVSEGDYFVIERSADGNSYETIGVLRKEGNSDHYELMDNAPPNGTDLYRIRYGSKDGHASYSKIMQVSLSGIVDFKFYPNPADKLLIIRTAHIVDIQVVDATGVVRLTRRLPSGIQVINISSLEKGVYVLRVADKESNRIISNQLLKN